MNTKAKPASGWAKMDAQTFMREKPGAFDPFSTLCNDWMILGAGTASDWNAMTAGWGTVGRLWAKDVAVCYVRPSRHTYGYMERSNRFTLSFFDQDRQSVLDFFGHKSGRDLDKAAGAGVDPVHFAEDAVSFAQARLCFVCRKLYAQDMLPELFKDPSIDDHYPKGDYHRMYVGEIEEVRVRTV